MMVLIMTPINGYRGWLNNNLHETYYEHMETPTRHKVFNFEQDFGGIGDGVTLNTVAFQYAIQAAKRYNEQLKDHDKKLRGVELIIGLSNENKTFLTGPFNLTSHFTLTVSASNSIIASPDPNLWPIIDPLPSYGQGRDHQGPRRVPFIGGFNLTDITIRGGGMIDGNGETWWKRHKSGKEKYTRGRLFETLYTDGVLLEDITLQNSPFWTIHPTVSSSNYLKKSYFCFLY